MDSPDQNVPGDDAAMPSLEGVDPAALRGALLHHVRQIVPLVSVAMAALYAFFGSCHIVLLPPRAASVMTPVAFGTSLAFLALAAFSRMRRLNDRWVHPVSALMAGAVLLNCLTMMELMDSPQEATHLILLLIGAGSLMLSRRWLAVVMVATWIGWAWQAAHSVTPGWQHFGFALVSATLLAGLIFVVRRRTLIRFERLRLQHERQEALMKAALLTSDDARHDAEIAQRNLEEAMRELVSSEKRLRLLIQQVPVVMWATDSELNITHHLGSPSPPYRSNIVGQNLVELLQDHEAREVPINAHRAALAGTPQSYEFEAEGVVYDAHVEPLKNSDGEVIGAVGLARDITSRKRALDALRESEHRYRDLFENATDLIQSVGPDGRLAYANRAWCQALGYTMDEAVGLSFEEFVHPDCMQHCHDVFRRVVSGESVEHVRVAFRAKDGRRIELEGNVNCKFENGQPVATRGIFRDVTERTRMQEELDRFFNMSFDMLSIANSDGYFKRINPAFTRTLGYRTEELLAQPFLDFVHPDDVESTLAEMNNLASGQPAVNFVNRYRCQDGSYRWFAWTSSPQLEGGVIYAVARDITEQRNFQEDLRKAKEAAESAGRAKSEFLARVGHEFRTPLNAILGMTELVLDSPLSAEQREYLVTARNSAEALLTVINDILDFSRNESLHVGLENVRLDVREIVRDVLRTLTPQVDRKGLDLHASVAPDVPKIVVGDPVRLRQILVNLVSNAVKFTGEGEVLVTVNRQHDAGEQVALEFRVTDTGIGIPKAKQQVIFDAFVQAESATSRRFGGTGLGLTIASQLVQLMGGQIRVDSEPGQGSTFSFVVPFAPDPQPGEPLESAAMPEPGEPGRPLTVLLVEDDEASRIVAQRMLERAGHEVIAVSDGWLALEEIEAAPDRFDLVLMDVMLPQMDGMETTRRIRKLEAQTDRRLPIVALTANAMEGDRQRCFDAGMDGYVAKPVRRHELLCELSRLTGVSLSVAAASSQPVSTALDWPSLEARCANDWNFVEEILSVFLDNSEAILLRLEAGLAAGSAEEVQHGAHKLKGSAATIGARRLEESASKLESLVVGQQSSQWPATVAELRTGLAELRDEIDEKLKRTPATPQDG